MRWLPTDASSSSVFDTLMREVAYFVWAMFLTEEFSLHFHLSVYTLMWFAEILGTGGKDIF